MRMFVTGADGQTARSLREAAASADDVELRCGVRPELDLARPETVRPAIEAFQPDLVINAAAYTAVDRAESEPELAFRINRDGAGAVAAAAAQVGVPVIQISTDYVFAGDKASPYVESDAVGPTGVYGRSKLEGERAAADANPRAIILRTAWVFAPYGANFVRTMLRLAGERDTLRVVDDQVGCPTYAPDIAEGLLSIARQLKDGGWRDSYAGVTHLAGPDAVSWCSFARKIMAQSALRGGPSPPVEAIDTAAYPTPAKRPANSRLDTARLAQLFNVRLAPLDDALARCVAKIVG